MNEMIMIATAPAFVIVFLVWKFTRPSKDLKVENTKEETPQNEIEK